MTVGDRIKLRRQELNLSQEELAKRAGYSDKTAISKLEHAGNDISLKQMKRVADALEVDTAFLLGWTETETELKNIQEQYQLPEEALEKINEVFKKNNESANKMASVIDKMSSAVAPLQKQYEKLLSSIAFQELFRAARGCNEEQIKLATEILNAFNNTNQGDALIDIKKAEKEEQKKA